MQYAMQLYSAVQQPLGDPVWWVSLIMCVADFTLHDEFYSAKGLT